MATRIQMVLIHRFPTFPVEGASIQNVNATEKGLDRGKKPSGFSTATPPYSYRIPICHEHIIEPIMETLLTISGIDI